MPAPSRPRRSAAALTALALGAAGAVGVAGPAFAVTYPVSSLLELQGALAAANASVGVPDIIEFDVAAPTSFDYAGSLEIDDDLTLQLAAGSEAVTLHSTDDDAVDVNGVPFTATGDISFVGDTGAGIFADAADVTLTGVTLSNSAGLGLFQINGGSLVATDVTASDNGSSGIAASGAITTFQLSGITVDGNAGPGVYLETSAPVATASLTDVTSTGNNGIGLNLQILGGTISVADTSTTGNSDSGLFFFVQGGVGTVTSVVATGNETGAHLWVDDGGVIDATGLTADSNDETGIDIWTQLGAVNVSSSTARFNGAGAPAALGGGVAVLVEDGSVTLDGVDASSNQADAGAGLGVSEISGGSSLTVRNSTVSDNIGSSSAGISIAQILDTGSSFDLVDSTVSGNESVGLGAGLAIETAGSATEAVEIGVTRSTISDNTAVVGSGLMVLNLFGAGVSDDVLTVDGSTISDNDGTTPGIVLQSAGSTDVAADIVSSTISGNTGSHGGVYLDRSGTGEFGVEITHSTITDNTADGGSGGVSVIDLAEASIRHSIVADNDGTDFFSDPGSNYQIHWSLVSDTSGSAAAAAAVGAGTGNIVGDPELGPLAPNGGTTRTHLPTAGSPAIDAGQPGIATAPATDQRGAARIQNGRIDMGAVEAAPLLPATGGSPAFWLVIVGVVLLVAGAAALAVRTWRRAH
jgi:LPXTG-motif cell wall-anchored protein